MWQEDQLIAPNNAPGFPTYFVLQKEDNDFVESHPRFAKANDVILYRRILGRVRWGLYDTTFTSNPPPVSEVYIRWGLCLIKGDYDNAGVWTRNDDPTPGDPGDEDDKWLHRDALILGWGQVIGGGDPVEPQRFRQTTLSNEFTLPNGSWIDLKCRRRGAYAERLCLVADVWTAGVSDQYHITLNYDLRQLYGLSPV